MVGTAARHAATLIMANKALSKRQKLTFRVEPSQKALKPRNPLSVPATQRAAGPRRKNASALRHLQNHALKKMFDEPDEG
jgi:hypothetical protein